MDTINIMTRNSFKNKKKKGVDTMQLQQTHLDNMRRVSKAKVNKDISLLHISRIYNVLAKSKVTWNKEKLTETLFNKFSIDTICSAEEYEEVELREYERTIKTSIVETMSNGFIDSKPVKIAIIKNRFNNNKIIVAKK